MSSFLLVWFGYWIAGGRIILLPSQIEQTAISPDGMYRATLVDGATGAWDDWDDVYLERNGQSLGVFNLSRQRADGDGDIDRLTWSEPNVLVISYRTNWGKGKTDVRWGDVRIVHRAPQPPTGPTVAPSKAVASPRPRHRDSSS